MAEFAPPQSPPPPKVPEGWTARWDANYSEWFYVNTYTKRSQWEKPTEPVYPSHHDDTGAPPGPPPTYDPNAQKYLGPEKLGSNNPYAHGGGGPGRSSQDISEDERLARQLQEEENARAGGSAPNRGASDSYYGQEGSPYGAQPPYGQQPGPGYDQQALPPRPESKSKGGFLGKLMGKASGSQSHHYPPQQQHGYGGYPPQQGYYGGGPPGGYYGGQPQYVQQGRPGRKPGGLGAGGAAALGAGGGLLGGLALGSAIDGGDGGGDGGDGGGDYGGGDGGGGDGGGFGGDDGGGDFGGGGDF